MVLIKAKFQTAAQKEKTGGQDADIPTKYLTKGQKAHAGVSTSSYGKKKGY